VVTTQAKQTASETVLLAADDLASAGKAEFTEWDLTVAAWSIDRFRFGLRGYAQSYPDHKRVMMEIMGQKPSSPVILKFLEKIRPNTYRLTASGKAAAAKLRGGAKVKPTRKPVTVRELYETVAVYAGKPEFRRWQENPEEPKDWAGAASFLGLTGKSGHEDPVQRLDEVKVALRSALDWCKVEEVAFLTRGSGSGGPPIHVRDVSDLLDFLTALMYRFPEYLDVEAGGKPKKRFN
jgi:hypothetical protein